MNFFKKLTNKKRGDSGSERGRKKDKDDKGSRSSSRGGSHDGESLASGDRRGSTDLRKRRESTGSVESAASHGARPGATGSTRGSTNGAQHAGLRRTQAERKHRQSSSSNSSSEDDRNQRGGGAGANGRGGSGNSNTRGRADLTYSPREQQPVSARSDLSTARPQTSTSDAPDNDCGYMVNEKDLPKLHLCAWQGKPELFKKYLTDGPNVTDRFSRTPLHLACARGNLEAARELVREGASTNITDANSRTPLMKAIECLHTDVVHFLVTQVARPNVNALDSEQNSCLHLAVYASARRLPASESATAAGSARERSFEIIRLLLNADAVLDKRNRDGLTPLHLVAQLGFSDAAAELLRRGADANALDSHRRTPLMLACAGGSAKLVELLVQNGAKTQLQDDKGQTAEDFAIVTKHSSLLDLLAGDANYSRVKPGPSAGAAAGTSTPPGSLGGGAAAKANAAGSAGRKEREADAGSWDDDDLGLDDPRARAAAATSKPVGQAVAQQPMSARSQDTLAGVPPLASTTADLRPGIREEEPADDWDRSEDVSARAGRANPTGALAASTLAAVASVGAPSVQEQTVQAAGRSGGAAAASSNGGAAADEDISDWDTSDPNAAARVRAAAGAGAAPPLVVMPDGGTRAGSTSSVPITATASAPAGGVKTTPLGPPLTISITERVRADTGADSVFVSAADFGSKRASGAETPEAPHTYRNLQQLGAVAADVPDAASAAGVELRRQLEEEAARRAQVEKQMRDLQMRELEAKRRLEEEQSRNARLEAERLQQDRSQRSRGEQDNQVIQQYEAELLKLKQQLQSQTQSFEEKLQQQRQIEALKNEVEHVRLTKERIDAERQRLDRQLQHERERVVELEMRMVTVNPGTGTGSGSVEAAGPGLVASTGQFASDMNLADGSPARPSGDTESADGEEWMARHAGQPTASSLGAGGEVDGGSPGGSPGGRAQPRGPVKVSRHDSTRSVEVYAIQRELEQEQSRRKTEMARWLVEKERLQQNIKELENLCSTREDAMNRAALQAQIDVRQLLNEKERITKELLDMTRERDELDRQAREHLRKIDELRLEAGDRDKTATETKDELLAQIEELKQKLYKTNCDLTRMDMLIQKVYELFRLRYRMAVGNDEQIAFLQPLVAELNNVADLYNVQLASPNGVVIRPNPGLEQLGLGAPYGEQPALNASPGPLSANALQLRDSVERLEMQLLGSVGGAVGNSGAANGALQLQPGAGAFDVNAPGRRVPLAHITLPPPPALPPKNDDSDTSSSESSDRGSKRRSKGSDRGSKHRGSKDSSSKSKSKSKSKKGHGRHHKRDHSSDEEDEKKKLEQLLQQQQKAAESTPEEVMRRAREAQLNAENEALLILWNEERDRAQMAAEHKQRAELALGELERGVNQQLLSVSMAPPPLAQSLPLAGTAPAALAAAQLSTPLRSSHRSPHRSSHHSRRHERPVHDEAGDAGESPERGGSRSSSWSSYSSGRSRSRSGSASEAEQLELERIRLAQQQQEMANAARQQQHQQQLTGMLSSLKGQLQATRAAVATGQPVEPQVYAQPPGSPLTAGLPPPGQSLPSSSAYLAAPSPDLSPSPLGARRRSGSGHRRHQSGHRSRGDSRGRRQRSPEKNGETKMVSQFQNLLGQHAQQLSSSLNQSLSDLKKELDNKFVDRADLEQLANQMDATRSAANMEAAETAQAMAAEMQMRTQQLADERERERAAQAERERRREDERQRYIGDLKKQFASSLSQMQGELSNARRAFEEQRVENSTLNSENRRLFDMYRTRQPTATAGARTSAGSFASRPLLSGPSLSAGYSSSLLLPAPSASTAPPPAALYTKLRRDLDRSITMHLEASGARAPTDPVRSSVGGTAPLDSSFKGLVGGKYLLT